MPRKKKTDLKNTRKYQTKEAYLKARIDRMLSSLKPAQSETLAEYAKFCAQKGKKFTSTYNYVTVLFKLGEYLKKPYKAATEKDLLAYLDHIADKAPTSRENWKTVIRKFYRFVYGGKYLTKKDLYPPVVDGTLWHSNGKPKARHIQSKKDLISKDDFLRMVERSNTRDKAWLMLLFEGGLRAEESTSLNRNSIEFDEYGAKIWKEKSKTKRNYVRVVDAAPFLKQWLNEHALKEPTAPLFYGLGCFYGERLLPKAALQMIKRAAKRAGIDPRKVWTHKLRHVAITSCKHEAGMDVDTIAKRHGITPATVRDVYLHWDDSDVDAAYLEGKGVYNKENIIKKKEEQAKTMPKKCAECGELNPWNAHYCEKCGQPVDLKTALQKDRDTESKLDRQEKMMNLFVRALQAKDKQEMANILQEITVE